jgi:hypothetical protein
MEKKSPNKPAKAQMKIKIKGSPEQVKGAIKKLSK